jgi:hypothetical protein
MMMRALWVTLMCVGLAGCFEEDYSSASDPVDYSNSGSASGGSYNWTYSCPGGYGGGGTVPIPSGSCESQYKNYAQVFGCNQVDNFNSAACALQNCTGSNRGCGSYQ